MKLIYSFFCTVAALLSTNHVYAVDQFRISCDCSSQYGWLSLNRSFGNWQLSNLSLKVDEFSGYFEPRNTPSKTYAYLQIKELKAGRVLTPKVVFRKIETSVNSTAISYADHNFNADETTKFVFFGKKYNFISVEENKERFLVLVSHRGQFRIGKLNTSETGFTIATIDWSGDLNRDGELDFVIQGLDDPSRFLFMSTKGNCYRRIPLSTNEDYIHADGYTKPAPITSNPNICDALRNDKP